MRKSSYSEKSQVYQSDENDFDIACDLINARRNEQLELFLKGKKEYFLNKTNAFSKTILIIACEGNSF